MRYRGDKEILIPCNGGTIYRKSSFPEKQKRRLKDSAQPAATQGERSDDVGAGATEKASGQDSDESADQNGRTPLFDISALR